MRTDLAPFIEHTCLKPDAPERAIEQLCAEARTWAFFGVCVASERVALAKTLLAGSTVALVSVVAFPHGHGKPEIVAREAALAREDGAMEIDLVAPLGAIRDGDFGAVERAVRGVRAVLPNTVLKVILETGYFSRVEIESAATAAMGAGADFLKTSTGFGPRGAGVQEVRWLAGLLQPGVRLKASGGIRSAREAEALLGAGAVRLGCSASVAIVTTP